MRPAFLFPLVFLVSLGLEASCSSDSNASGVIPETGGEEATPASTGGDIGGLGGRIESSGGTTGAGGTNTGSGGATTSTGGRVATTGGRVAATGGKVASTGGVAVATGGTPISTGGIAASTDSSPRSSLTGQNHGSGYFTLNSGPPFNYFIGAWTHVQPPMGSGTKGNDYPFGVICQEGQVSFVSGNFKSAYKYNANIMTFNEKGTYIADYTLLLDATSTEEKCRDWVYVGWHFRRNGTATMVTQYVKYVGSTNLVDRTLSENVPGNWTPTKVKVGSDPTRYPDTAMYTMYARIYAMDTAPTPEQLSAIYSRSATPDPTAWADWPLINGSPNDVSGNGRHLTVNGSIAVGILGPPQTH